MELESHDKLAVSVTCRCSREKGWHMSLAFYQRDRVPTHSYELSLHGHRHYCSACQLFTQFTLIEHLLIQALGIERKQDIVPHFMKHVL